MPSAAKKLHKEVYHAWHLEDLRPRAIGSEVVQHENDLFKAGGDH